MNFQPPPAQPQANQYKVPEQIQNIGNNVLKKNIKVLKLKYQIMLQI